MFKKHKKSSWQLYTNHKGLRMSHWESTSSLLTYVVGLLQQARLGHISFSLLSNSWRHYKICLFIFILSLKENEENWKKKWLKIICCIEPVNRKYHFIFSNSIVDEKCLSVKVLSGQFFCRDKTRQKSNFHLFVIPRS